MYEAYKTQIIIQKIPNDFSAKLNHFVHLNSQMVAKNLEGKNAMIKIYHKQDMNEEDKAEIINLWETSKLLDHPNIMGVSRIFEDGEQIYIEYENDGENLIHYRENAKDSRK